MNRIRKTYHKHLLRNLILVLLGFCANSLSAQSPQVFDQFTTKEGLSHNTINCITQDSLGFMWFGSMDGLCRFDGYDFKAYKSSPNNNNSLCHNLIKSICVDGKGSMWIGTAHGLSHFNIKLNQFTNYYSNDNSGLSHNNIEMVYCDRKKNIWVATLGGGLNKFDPLTQSFTSYKSNKSSKGKLSNDNVHWVFEDSKGTIWVGTEGGGLNRMHSDTSKTSFDFFQFEPEDGNFQALNCVRSIQEDHNGNIWVGTWGGGTAKLNQQKGVFNYFRKDTENEKGVSDSRVISILSTSNQQILFGTEDGGLNIFRFKDQSFEHVKMDRLSPYGLKSNNIRAIYEDRSLRVWLGSSGGGVFSFQLGKSTFSNISIKDQNFRNVDNQDIYAIAGDDKSLWLGTNGGGLYRGKSKSDKENAKLPLENMRFNKIELSSNIVHALCHDSWGRLWAGTLGGGLNLIEYPLDENRTPKITSFTNKGNPLHTVSYNDIRTLYNDKSGNLWIGTAGGGLDKLILAKRGEYYFEHYKNNPENNTSISNNDIRAITEDQGGNIWIGTSNGLNKLTSTNGKVKVESFYSEPTKRDRLSGNSINSLYVDFDDLLWIGTDAGLNSLDPKTNKIQIYTEQEGIVNNVIKSIKGDQFGNLWITTVNGLSMFTKTTKSFYNFYESDGLLSNEFNSGALFASKNGPLFVGGTKGLNSFIPDQVLQNNQINSLLLTDFKIFNQSVSVGDSINGRVLLNQNISVQQSIQLKYFENSFSFEFAALDYSNPEKISYQYLLEGFNKNWQETDAEHRFATYTNLGGGNYKFKLRSFTGVPGDSTYEHSIDIQIDYPYWLRWWAFIAYFAMLALLYYLTWNYYRNKLKLAEDLKLANIQREQEQELIRLKQRFFMNVSHELKTPLTLITGPLERISQNTSLSNELRPLFDLMKRNSAILSRLITQLMDFSKQERGALKLQLCNIEIIEFMHKLMHSFQDMAQQRNIQFSLASDSEKIWVCIDLEKMEKVIFNLLSNAFKYTPENGTIVLKINKELHKEEILSIEVKDSGKGIAPTHQSRIFDRFYQIDSDHSETGSGIGLSLVKELINLHKGTIAVTSELEKGCCFTIQIPLSKLVIENESCTISPSIKEESISEKNTQEIEVNSNNSNPIILIVEDNMDLRSYLNMILSPHYEITTANNGEEGVKIALQMIPDLIVSDVMMPKMDGITFCRKVKSKIEISHVPVILLTAKSGKENTLTGFESGADDYVSKPFDPDLLVARIGALLASRNRICKHLQNNPLADLPKNKLSNLDRTFLEKVDKIAKKHMASSDFSVEELGRQIGMSRTTLYRKIKGLTGMTAIEYLRTIRLKEALKMIKTENDSLQNISERIGFTDLDYFKKCFKKQFGFPPEDS